MPTNKLSMSIARTGRVFLVVALGLTAVASAKAAGTAEQRAACTPDAIRLCSSEIPDVGRVTACMRAKQASLSPRCRAAFLGAPTNDTTAAVAQQHRVRSFGSTHGLFRQASFVHGRGKHSARQAMMIAGQVFSMLGAACQSGSAPAELCSGSFLGSSNGFGAGNLAGLSGLIGQAGLLDSFGQ
jgi:hypothetical protein